MELAQSTLSASFIDKGPGNCCSGCWGASNMASCCCAMAASVTASAPRQRPARRAGGAGSGLLSPPAAGAASPPGKPGWKGSGPARIRWPWCGCWPGTWRCSTAWSGASAGSASRSTKVRHWLNRNTLTGSRSNIAAHYDLGNALYQGFLDSHMQYSSAIYPSADASLEEGQQAKLRTICERLALGPDDHLLEIGTGWVASPSMPPVTMAAGSPPPPSPGPSTTTPRRGSSGRGWRIASPFAAGGLPQAGGHLRQAGLHRDDRGGGARLSARLFPPAVTPAQARRSSADPGHHHRRSAHAQYLRGVDFIQRYIFPGGCLPCVSQMAGLLARGDRHAAGAAARSRPSLCPYPGPLVRALPGVGPELPRLGYSQDFIRLWHFYFAYCEGGFWEQAISLVQLEAASRAPWLGGRPAGKRSLTMWQWAHLLGFNLYWVLAVRGEMAATAPLLALLLLHFLFSPPPPAGLAAHSVALAGCLLDGLLWWLGLFHFSSVFPLWLVLLWCGFALTLSHGLRWLRPCRAGSRAVRRAGGASSYVAGPPWGSKLTLGHLDQHGTAGGDLDVVVTRTPVGNGQAGG